VDGKQPYQLWGESVRDIGILFVVFGPLDTLLKKDYGKPWDWALAILVAILGFLLIRKGVEMESEPDSEQ